MISCAVVRLICLTEDHRLGKRTLGNVVFLAGTELEEYIDDFQCSNLTDMS